MKAFIIITTIICLLAIIFAIVYPLCIKAYIMENNMGSIEEKEEKIKSRHYLWRVPVILLALAIMIFIQSFTIIPTGYSGVRTIFGQVQDAAAHKGFNWKIPFVEKN